MFHGAGFLAPLAIGWWATLLVAQDAPSPIDDAHLERRILAACAARHAAGDLRSCASLLAEPVAKAVTAAIAVPPPVRSKVLSGPDVHDVLAPSVRIVGHYYLCRECEEWHFSGASGFCVAAAGAVATCHHVIGADETMREAFLVVADLRGNVWPVERVLAADKDADVCIVATAEHDCVPLPLRTSARTGERVYCLSHPDHQFGFFSEGVVARLFLAREGEEADGAPTAPLLPWLHVTCDFAGGSSGAPVVDACGNVVGIAQATTTQVADEGGGAVDTQMVFKTAVPAAALLALLAPRRETPAAEGSGR